MTKKYKKSDLDIHSYGKGHGKLFIMYTDFEYIEGKGPGWSTRVYPDITGNKAKATKQALDWLNGNEVGRPYVVRNSRKKISITYKFGY